MNWEWYIGNAVEMFSKANISYDKSQIIREEFIVKIDGH